MTSGAFQTVVNREVSISTALAVRYEKCPSLLEGLNSDISQYIQQAENKSSPVKEYLITDLLEKQIFPYAVN